MDAELTASRGDPAPLLSGVDRRLAGEDHCWSGEVGDWVAYAFKSPVSLTGFRMIGDSNFSDAKRMPCSFPAKGNTAAVPDCLIRDVDLEIRDASGEWVVVVACRDNRRRLIRQSFDAILATEVRCVIKSTWGATAHLFAFEVKGASVS